MTTTFVVFILLFFPIWGRFQLDADEGVNLGQAMLLEQGAEFYEDFWSDQPPMFNYMLAAVIRIFGHSVPASRILSIGFSALLFWSTFQILATFRNLRTALAGLLMLILTEPFIRVSYAVMRGLPAISLAMFSMYAIMKWHKTLKNGWIILSAIALGLSVTTKLFTGLLAPVFLVGLIMADRTNQTNEWTGLFQYKRTLTWLSILSVLIGSVVLLGVGLDNIDDLIIPHIEARSLERFQEITLSISFSLLILSLLGTMMIFKDKNWIFLYPISWMVLSYSLLVDHTPVWYHQELLITAPAVLIAAYAIDEGLLSLTKLIRQKPALKLKNLANNYRWVTLIFFVAYLFAVLPPRYIRNFSFRAYPEFLVESFTNAQMLTLASINQYSNGTELILTDKPMFSYRTGIPMPWDPASIITGKRYFSGNLTEDEIIQVVDDYSPEQILLGRYEYPKVYEHLDKGYTLLEYDGSGQHYVINYLVD